MNKAILLQKLEELYNLKEVKNGFPSQQACINWSNKVAPLLKFNELYYKTFRNNSLMMHQPLSSRALLPIYRTMVSQLQMAIEELNLEIVSKSSISPVDDSEDSYIDETRINELQNISNKKFDLSKLIQILKELNVCYKEKCYFSVMTLTRALIDHVPPIFNYKTFSEVANNYLGSKSFKGSMKHLESSSRKIADQHLHCPIRKREVLPNQTQVNFSNDIDVLLSEIVRILK